jgi:hypothetical protein
MCSSPSEGVAMLLNTIATSTMTLERLLDLERQIYDINRDIKSCDKCCSDLRCTIEVLKALAQLSILYKAAQTKYAFPRTSDRRYEAASETTAGKQAGLPRLEKSPVRFGRFELEEEESDIVGRTVVKQGLSRMHGTIKAIRRHAQSEVEGIRASSSSGIHRKLAQVAEIDTMAEAILSRVWETIAHGRL